MKACSLCLGIIQVPHDKCKCEDWADGKLTTKPDNKKLIDALRKARKYIRTVESCRKEGFGVLTTRRMIDRFAEGDEVEAIEAALTELGVTC